MGEHREISRTVERQPWLAYGSVTCSCGWEHRVGPLFSLVEAEDAIDAAWAEHTEAFTG